MTPERVYDGLSHPLSRVQVPAKPIAFFAGAPIRWVSLARLGKNSAAPAIVAAIRSNTHRLKPHNTNFCCKISQNNQKSEQNFDIKSLTRYHPPPGQVQFSHITQNPATPQILARSRRATHRFGLITFGQPKAALHCETPVHGPSQEEYGLRDETRSETMVPTRGIEPRTY